MEYFEVKGISKSYSKKNIINDISFQALEGEVLAIIGLSGGGKTTLLRCLTFLEKPDGGEIYLKGEKIYSPEMKNIDLENQLRIGYVFQDFNLFPHLNVLKNLTLSPNLRGRKNNIEKARELLKLVGLEDKEEFYPYQLSGGQKQRVAIARCLMLDPDVIFFDEPTSALDPFLTQEVVNIILMLKGQNRTIVVVTHEMDFAAQISDKVMIIDNGEVGKYGPTADVFNNDFDLFKKNKPC